MSKVFCSAYFSFRIARYTMIHLSIICDSPHTHRLSVLFTVYHKGLGTLVLSFDSIIMHCSLEASLQQVFWFPI